MALCLPEVALGGLPVNTRTASWSTLHACSTTFDGLASSTHPGWWIISGLGGLGVIGALTTGKWARRTASEPPARSVHMGTTSASRASGAEVQIPVIHAAFRRTWSRKRVSDMTSLGLG